MSDLFRDRSRTSNRKGLRCSLSFGGGVAFGPAVQKVSRKLLQQKLVEAEESVKRVRWPDWMGRSGCQKQIWLLRSCALYTNQSISSCWPVNKRAKNRRCVSIVTCERGGSSGVRATMALLGLKAVCWLGREIETIGVKQRWVAGMKGGRHDRQCFEQVWPALLSAQWH